MSECRTKKVRNPIRGLASLYLTTIVAGI